MGIDPKDMNLTPENMKKLQQKAKGKGKIGDMNFMLEILRSGTADKSDALKVVYVNTGENIYHREGCRLIRKGAKSMIKLHAKLSLKSCSVCKPHVK